MSNKYCIVKNKKNSFIVNYECSNFKGLDFTPKKNVKIKNSIDVSKMIIISPSLIEQIIRKKIKKRFMNLFNYLNMLYSSSDEDPEGLRVALNEITKLKLEIINKYRIYLKEKEFELNIKKINILENEVRLRLNEIFNQNVKEKEGKSR